MSPASTSSGLVLFIDIDGTLLRRRPDVAPPPVLFEHELLDLMVRQCVAQGRMSQLEAHARVQQVMADKVWWDWLDFLLALKLEPKAFWRSAGHEESLYLEPCHPRVKDILQGLRDAGHRCCITSNNPSSGIRHKLRLAGLQDAAHDLFDDCLGTDRIQAMKGSPAYWRGALNLAQAEPGEVVTIGDSINDDVVIPRQVGIQRHVVIHEPPREPWSQWPGVSWADDWSMVPQRVAELRQAAMLAV